jgi:hypothetical protein
MGELLNRRSPNLLFSTFRALRALPACLRNETKKQGRPEMAGAPFTQSLN